MAQAAGIAVSENAVHAIWAQSGEEQYARSLDDGVTWQDNLTLSASGVNVYNHYIVTSGSVVLAFWRAAADDAVVFARSSDEGASWGSTSQLGSGTVVLWGVEQEGSQVVVLWSDNRTDTGGDFDYYVSVSPDLGVTWVDPRLVVSVPQSSAYSAGLGLFGGSFVVLYEDTTSGTYDLFAAVSDSGTDPWDTSDRVQWLGSQYGPTHLAWDGARIVGVWNRHSSVAADANPWSALSEDGGSTWSTPEIISASTGFNVLGTQVLSTVVGFYALYADYAGQAIYYSRLLDDAWTADSSPRPAASLHSAASSPRHVFAAEM